MAINVRPLGDRILVEPAEEKETKKGGIIIPDSAKEKPTEGIVVALGTGKTDDNGKKVPFEMGPRREGDPPVRVGEAVRDGRVLPRRDTEGGARSRRRDAPHVHAHAPPSREEPPARARARHTAPRSRRPFDDPLRDAQHDEGAREEDPGRRLRRAAS